MPTVSRSFSVPSAPQPTIAYLADFTNAVEWDPGTQSCTRNDSGPIRVGATWHNTSKILWVTTELTYTLESLTDDKVVLVGRNKSATSAEIITVKPEGSGSRITYRNDLELRGGIKLASPVMKVLFEKLGGEVERRLVEVLSAR